MQTNTAGNLVEFLNLVPDRSQPLLAQPLERMGDALSRQPEGLNYTSVMDQAKVSKPEFIDALQKGVETRLLVIDDSGDQPILKLTPVAQTVFGS